MKRNEVDRSKLSPMMTQYMEVKDNYESELLFYRLGDFYELFFEDGITASRELELTLTGKNAGLEERIPMCGVPHHSVKPYIEKLVNKGYKVAIGEQLEDAKNTKGIVKRGVVQVYSKGTMTDLELLDAHDNSYIGSVLDFDYLYVLTYADISTGSIHVTSIPHIKDKLLNEILNLGLKEVVLENNTDFELCDLLKRHYGIEVSFEASLYENGYAELIGSVEDLKYKTGVKHLLQYLVVRELKDVTHLRCVEVVNRTDYLEMDVHSVRNLELVETLRLKERTFSLVWLLDKCKTAMGSRKLKNWLMNPLRNKEQIEERYDSVDKLISEFIIKDNLRKSLYDVYDIERLCGKVLGGSFNARDMIQLKNSLLHLPSIKEMINELKFPYKLNIHGSLFELLERAINDDNPPISLKEGYLIKSEYNVELDELKNIRSGGKSYLSQLENNIKNETGIKSLKVGYNKIFGYYIEVSKGQVPLIPDNLGWERRQTLTNYERYITPALKEKEALILNAEEKIFELEYNLFIEIKDIVKNEINLLLETANIISEIDSLCALAVAAEEHGLVRPILSDDSNLEIIEGRHPVVEIVSKNNYVANDCVMDENCNTLLITGPNMSGKSTFMRQLAIIIIMAQMGSFVPAKSAKLPIFDKIFTRIGASDDLVSGESTFMVEMMEARNAISNATKNSLILFDELGRGTATYDGMSLAESILEYVNTKIKCKTLFSTHYHELTKMEKKFDNLKNVHVAATEEDGKITFLHKVKAGAVDKSYGIHVARLAKMPEEVIKRAEVLLNEYESKASGRQNKTEVMQLAFDFSETKNTLLEDKLNEIDPLKITPLDAINLIYELKDLNR